ncbi:MAG: peptide ABC transporter substrate-binding protein [Alphaproteobacteria bacterium]|nr:MAG: peptide ABC transporter substrate-binding protein [Alphaproteobacteria bacterium]
MQLFRGLLGYDGQGNIRPELARSWEAEDARTYRFDLEPQAKFHDGSPVTSADVKASYEAMMAEDSTAYLRVALSSVIDSIETPDDHTVRMHLKNPSASFVYLAASFFAFIISAKSLAEDPGNPVGAGPYRITNLERGTRIDMEAFPDFYKPGLPKSKTLSFIAYKDENLRVAALEAGDVDIIEYVPWQSMDFVEQNENLVLDTTDGPFMYLLFNVSDGPLADARVRDAIGYAIKREDVMAAAFFGRGRPLNGMPVPESSPFFNPDLASHWSYDPARAKAMLAEAGYGDGFDCVLLSTAQYGMHKDTAEVCQQHLQAVGIRATLNLPDWATRVDLGNKGQYDIAVMGTAGQYNDPDALANFVDGRRGPSFVRSHGFNDDRLNELLDQGVAEIDQARRKAIYDEWQKRALETVPLVGINWRAQGYAWQKGVHGFANIPGFLTFYSGSMIELAEYG